MHNPDIQVTMTPAIVYLLHKSAKNGVPITGVVRALDPDMTKFSLGAVTQRIKKTLARFTESKRALHRHLDTNTLGEAPSFLCNPLAYGVPSALTKKGIGQKKPSSGGKSNRAAMNNGAAIDTRAAEDLAGGEILMTTKDPGGQSVDDAEQFQILASSSPQCPPAR